MAEESLRQAMAQRRERLEQKDEREKQKRYEEIDIRIIASSLLFERTERKVNKWKVPLVVLLPTEIGTMFATGLSPIDRASTRNLTADIDDGEASTKVSISSSDGNPLRSALTVEVNEIGRLSLERWGGAAIQTFNQDSHAWDIGRTPSLGELKGFRRVLEAVQETPYTVFHHR